MCHLRWVPFLITLSCRGVWWDSPCQPWKPTDLPTFIPGEQGLVGLRSFVFVQIHMWEQWVENTMIDVLRQERAITGVTFCNSIAVLHISHTSHNIACTGTCSNVGSWLVYYTPPVRGMNTYYAPVAFGDSLFGCVSLIIYFHFPPFSNFSNDGVMFFNGFPDLLPVIFKFFEWWTEGYFFENSCSNYFLCFFMVE